MFARSDTKTEELRLPPSARYQDWRAQFAAERLVVLYYLGLVANPVFIGADLLLHRDHLASLLAIRAVLELGLLVGFVFVKFRPGLVPPNALLVFWVLVGNLCIVHMTVVLGGFTAQYYNGLNLVFLAAAVIVPISWPSHLVAQLGTLLYYYGANLLHASGPADFNAAIENSFFLVWTCIALLFSIYLYERLQRAEFEARMAETRARAELEASNRKLLELDSLKSEFFANISHELRTPLTLSLGAFKTLLSLAPTAQCEELIQSGLRNTARLLFLINELLDLAKFDSGRAKLQKQCIDLAALVRGVAANFESSHKSRIHVKGGAHPVLLEADPRQLKKVLYNLLANAFKFSDPDEGQVWIRLNAKPDAVQLDIEDNGIGIPEDQLQRIFDRFTQVEGSATRRYEGSGIGLALVKEIVALHGGTITVESQLGRGSLFMLTLPSGEVGAGDLIPLEDEEEAMLVPPRPDHGPTPVQSKDSLPTSERGAALLLVADDNADMRAYLGRVLGRHYRVALAHDGLDALNQAKSLRPDLILTDMMMPRMSGPDLLNAVRADSALRSTPVVFLTARAATEARVESLQAGADDYIAKPFDENELLARVGNLIRVRAQERQLAQLQKEKMARFLPSHLADMILADREEFLKGHRTEITVVFIDLRGFTAFAEIAAPEEVMAVLREYQTEMGRLVSDHDGTLERFSGDAMMIFFNDPLPVPNHAEQAARLAIAMRQRVAELQARWRKRGFDLGAGIGIATGYATLGAIGFEGRQDYAAIGPVTNLAARLCGEARNGQVLTTGRFLELVERLTVAEPIGDLVLKGFQRPVSVYNVTGLRVAS